MGLPRLPESAVARQGDGILGPSHACGCRSAIVSGCLPSLNPPRSFSCPPAGEEPPGHLRQSKAKAVRTVSPRGNFLRTGSEELDFEGTPSTINDFVIRQGATVMGYLYNSRTASSLDRACTVNSNVPAALPLRSSWKSKPQFSFSRYFGYALLTSCRLTLV